MNETPQEYTQRILGLVTGKEPQEVQRETASRLAKLIKPLSEKQLSQRPEPAKWSINEILAHLADSAIVPSWRMRLVICQNGPAMQATDQDVWSQALDYAGQDPKCRSRLSACCARTICACSRRYLKTFGKTTGCILSAARRPSPTSSACMPATTSITSSKSKRSSRVGDL